MTATKAVKSRKSVSRKSSRRRASKIRTPLRKLRRTKLRQRSGKRLSKYSRSKLVSPSGCDLSKMKDPDTMKNIKFDSYIKKIQKKVHPDNSLTTESLRVLNCWMKGMLHQIGKEISNRMGRRKVIKPKIINRAMKRIVPKNIREEANRRGMLAVEKYKKSMGRRR